MARRRTFLFIATIGYAGALLAQAGDANTVMAAMRAAIGGADRIAAVKTLAADGVTLSPMGQSSSESQTSLAMAQPDKYVARRMLTPMFGGSYRRTGFNGNGVINETEVPSTPGSRILIRTRGQVWPSGPLPPDQRAAQVRQTMMEAKHDFARTTVAMFGASFEAFPLQFGYAGQEQLAEGRAHVIQVTGDGGFEARLFVDTATSLPLMLTWQDYAPWVATSSTREHALGEPAVQRQTEAFTAQWDKAEAALRRVEYRVHYSNFTMADGLKLPHTITRTVDGKVKDTTTFRVIRINQPIDDSRFSISKSQ